MASAGDWTSVWYFQEPRNYVKKSINCFKAVLEKRMLLGCRLDLENCWSSLVFPVPFLEEIQRPEKCSFDFRPVPLMDDQEDYFSPNKILRWLF